MLYGSEIWGFEEVYAIEKIHLEFCKNILKVRKTTPNYMEYGELGRYPLRNKVKMRMISYWNRVVSSSNENKICGLLYRLALILLNDDAREFQWLRYIKGIFNAAGLNYVFDLQGELPFDAYKLILKQQMNDEFLQKEQLLEGGFIL